MKIFQLIHFCLFFHFAGIGQISISERSELLRIERKMMPVAIKMSSDSFQPIRQKNTYDFIKLLKIALQHPKSFYYPFDSLKSISKVYAPDSAFRVFTFQLVLDNQNTRQYGCIQLRDPSKKIIPLIDMSDTFPLPPQKTISNKNWYGSLYYQIIEKTVNKQKVYFMFGYDQNDVFSRKKIVEPMWIVGDTAAYFGKPLFIKTTNIDKTDKNPRPKPKIDTLYRYVLEYSSRANATLRFDHEKQMIMLDHVIHPNPKYNDLAFTRVPDGSYQGMKWENEKWIWQDTVSIGKEDSNKPIENKSSVGKKKLIFNEE